MEGLRGTTAGIPSPLSNQARVTLNKRISGLVAQVLATWELRAAGEQMSLHQSSSQLPVPRIGLLFVICSIAWDQRKGRPRPGLCWFQVALRRYAVCQGSRLCRCTTRLFDCQSRTDLGTLVAIHRLRSTYSISLETSRRQLKMLVSSGGPMSEVKQGAVVIAASCKKNPCDHALC